MGELAALPNIGKVLEKTLNDAGIFTREQLVQAGSKDAFVRIRVREPDACLNMLRALEGAIKGVRWHVLPADKKAELEVFYRGL